MEEILKKFFLQQMLKDFTRKSPSKVPHSYIKSYISFPCYMAMEKRFSHTSLKKAYTHKQVPPFFLEQKFSHSLGSSRSFEVSFSFLGVFCFNAPTHTPTHIHSPSFKAKFATPCNMAKNRKNSQSLKHHKKYAKY